MKFDQLLRGFPISSKAGGSGRRSGGRESGGVAAGRAFESHPSGQPARPILPAAADAFRWMADQAQREARWEFEQKPGRDEP